MKTKQEMLQQIQKIFEKEFENESLVITLESSPNNVENWDSINNLSLMAAIEEEFGVEFPIDAMFKIKNVNDIIDHLQSVSK
ncbi:MAG: acyl carrier protein [Cyclobacteriaceae bacterium]|nr:acyl carrier protein [Cyclobacteriaceae bacterium]